MGRNDLRGYVPVADGDEFSMSSGSTVSAAPGGTIVTATFPAPVTEAEELDALSVARRARWSWPYLSLPLSKAANGRETGAFIAGILYTRSSPWAGMSVDVLESHVAGCLAMLFDAGIAVSPGGVTPFREGGAPKRLRLDCWIESGGEQGPEDNLRGPDKRSGVEPEVEVTITAAADRE